MKSNKIGEGGGVSECGPALFVTVKKSQDLICLVNSIISTTVSKMLT